MSNRVTTLLFDMDGLMFDTETVYSRVGQEVLGKRGCEFNLELKRRVMGLRLNEVWSYFKNYYQLPDEVSVLVDEARQTYEKYLLADDILKPMPGLMTLLDQAKKEGLNLILATASEKKWVDLIFRKFSLQDYFTGYITSEDVAFGKPHPEIYQKAVKLAGQKADLCLVLEDSVNGIKSAKAAGCLAAAVPNQYTLGQDFKEADIVVSSLEDGKLISYIFCDT
ncbi:MAG: HAD family hydrolase [Patescibacteria group bacterium]